MPNDEEQRGGGGRTKTCPVCGADNEPEASQCFSCNYTFGDEETLPEQNGNGMMECPSCGAVVSPGSTSCMVCGVILGEQVPAEPEPAPVEEEYTVCPSCGSDTPAGSESCMVCGARLAGGEEAPAEEAPKEEEWDAGAVSREKGAPVEEGPKEAPQEPALAPEPVKEEEETPLEKPKPGPNEFACPSCGKPVAIGSARCPNCWADLPEMTRCPHCDFVIPLTATACPECFAKLENGRLVEAPAAAEEEIQEEVSEEPEEALMPKEEEEEALEEITELYGVQCPFCNAVVNASEDICPECGMALVEGGGEEEEEEKPEPYKHPERDWYKITAVCLVFILLISAIIPFAVPLPRVDREHVRIDGNFGEWLAITNNTDALDTANPNINLVNAKVASDAFNVYFYSQVQGEMFGDAIGAVERVFMDTDQDSSTGYMIQGIGADYQVRLFGRDGDVESASCLRFNQTRDRNDFNGFESFCPAIPYANGTECEIRISLEDLGLAMAQRVTSVYYMGNTNGEFDISDYPVTNLGGVLLVHQSSIAPANGIVTGAAASMLNLDISVSGDYAIINNVVIADCQVTGATFPVNLTRTDTLTLTVTRDVRVLGQTNLAHSEAIPADFTVSNAQVLVTGTGAYAYVGSAPPLIAVDGAFADWTGKGQRGTDAVDDVMAKNNIDAFDNAALDIIEYATEAENNNVNFFLDVGGEMFAGFEIPVKEETYIEPAGATRSDTQADYTYEATQSEVGTRQASPSIRPPATYQPKKGEDCVLIFLDTDNSTSTGYLVNALGADRLVEVRGQHEIVTDTFLYQFQGNDQNAENWSQISSASVLGASDGTRMEASAPINQLSATGEITAYFHVIDWDRNGDLSDYAIWDVSQLTRRGGTRAPPASPTAEITGSTRDTGGNLVNSTVIGYYPRYNAYIASKQGITQPPFVLGEGAYWLMTNWTTPASTRRLYINASANTNWINNSATTYSQDFSYNLLLNTYSPYVPLNFTLHNYGTGPRVLLDWDYVDQPPGGYRIFRTDDLWYSPSVNGWRTPWFAPAISVIANGTTGDFFVDEAGLVEGTTYYYFIAALSATGTPIAYSELQWLNATSPPEFPYMVRGFAKDPLGNTLPGVTVTVQNFNYTNVLQTHTQVTDALGRYAITLQPEEYRFDNSTVWCNGSMGDLRGYNWTTIPAWWWWGSSDYNSESVCNITLWPPNVTTSKTVNYEVASPSQTLTYTIWVNNSNTWNATIVWVNDTLPDGVTYISDSNGTANGSWTNGISHASWGQVHNWTFWNVTPGSHWFTISVMINSTVANGTYLVNWVYMNYSCMANVTTYYSGNFSLDNATTLVMVSNITVNKTVDLGIANPGNYLTYTIYFNNTGGTNATSMWINDTLPVGVTFVSHTANDPVLSPTSQPYYQGSSVIGQNLWFNFTNVPPGPHSFTITVQIDADVANNTWLTNWVYCNYTTEFGKRPESYDSATTLVIRPYVFMNKTVDLSEALPGDLLTYTIWFNNSGENATRVWVNDTMPTGVLYVTDTADTSPTSWLYLASRDTSSNPLRYVFNDVPYGPHSFTITVRIADFANYCTWLNNTVVGNYTPCGVESFANASTHVIRPVINFTKIANVTAAYPGQTVNYTIYFNNTDTAPATNVWINDTLPAGVSYINDSAWMLSSIFAGSWNDGVTWYYNFTNVMPGDYSFNITVLLDSYLNESQILTNWAIINYTQANGLKYGPYLGGPVYIVVIGGPLIQVSKIVSQETANTGEQLTYWIFFNNSGNGNASFVWINDTLPAGVTYVNDTAWTLGAMFAGAWDNGITWFYNFTNVLPGAHSFLIYVNVTNDTDMTALTNWVYCNYTSISGVHAPETNDSATFVLQRPIIVVGKTVDKGVAAPGDILNYTIWYNNTGSFPADVWINDTIPAGTTYLQCSLGSPDIVNGSQYTWHVGIVPAYTSNVAWIEVQVNITSSSGAYLNNTVELNYTCPASGYQFAGSMAVATTIVSAMVAEKIVDLAYANPGDFLNYTIYFNNTANFTIPFAWINDTLPAGVIYVNNTAATDLPGIFAGFWQSGQTLYFNFTNIPPYSYNSFQITVQINLSVPPGTWLNNTATLAYKDILGNGLPSSVDVIGTMVNSPIIEVIKSVNQTTVYPGDEITYTIWIWNNGSINASEVWVNDTFPSWLQGISWAMVPPLSCVLTINGTNYSWHITDLPVGLTTITITATIDSAIPDNTNITNFVYCVYQMANDIGWNTTSNVTAWVVSTNISVQKTVDKAIAYPGDYLTYTIWYNNTGHGVAADVWVNDTLPADVIYITSSAPWTEDPTTLGDNRYSWHFANVAPGVYSFTITVQVNTDAVCGQNLTNYVLCEYCLANGLGWSSEGWANTTIIRPNITVVKTVNLAEANPGDYLVYTIYFNNTCQGTAYYVNITDELPNWVTFVNHTAGSVANANFVFPMGMSGRFLWFNFTNVLPGEHNFTIWVRVNMDTPDCPTLVNNVTCEYGLLNGVAFAPSFDNASTHINRPAIEIVKVADYAVAAPGFYLNYTITVYNNASGTAQFIWVNDTLPNGVVYVTDNASSVPWYSLSGFLGQTRYYIFADVPGFTNFTFQITVWIDPGYGHSPGEELWNWAWLNYTAENGFTSGQASDGVLTIISNMAIIKEVDLDHAGPGAYLNYTITFDNTGITTAAFVWINDTLPAGVDYVNDTAWLLGYPFTFYQIGQNLYYEFRNVTGGSFNSFQITVIINSSAVSPGDILDNWAYMNFTNDYGVSLIESWDNAITLVDRANITVVKIVNQTIAFPGDYLNYTIYFNNTGQASAAFVWINDTLPSGVVWVNDSAWTVPGFAGWWSDGTTWYYNFTDLPPGNYSFNITVQILTTVANGTNLSNLATCEYTTGTFKHEISMDWSPDTIVVRPIIALEKIVDKTEATIGEVLTYTIYFNNTGLANASVNITDILDVGLVMNLSSLGDYGSHTFVWRYWNPGIQTLWLEFADVAPGVHYVWFTVNVSTAVAECNWLDNTAFLNYSLPNGVSMNPAPLWDVVSTHIVVPNVTVNKSVDRSVASPGDYLTYTITFTNWNNGTAGSVNITDVLPNGVVYVSDTANTLSSWFVPPTGQSGQTLYFNFSNVPTGSYSFNIVVYINPSVSNSTTLMNWAFLNYTTTTGINITGNAANATTLITWMAVVKVVSQEIVGIGDLLVYTIYFNNTANYTMLYVWLNDTLPSGVVYITDTAAAPGGAAATFNGSWNDSVTWYYNFTNVMPGPHWFTITVLVDYSNIPGTQLSNFAQLNYTDNLGFPMQGSVDWSPNATVASPELLITKEVDLSEANPGDQLVYTMTIENIGTDATGIIWVNDTLPSWLSYVMDNTSSLPMPPFVGSFIVGNQLSFIFINLTPGTSISFTITVLVSTATPDVTTITNWAYANYTSLSGYKMDEIYDAATTIVRRPVITVQKTVDKNLANPADTLVYTIWYNNTGTGIAGDIWINDTLPIEVQYQSDTSGLPIGPNGHNWSGQFHSWHFTNVAPGSYSFTITVVIDSSIPNCRWFNNSAFWIYASLNHIAPAVLLQQSNNATTHVIAPNLTIEKSVDMTQAAPGDFLTYTIWLNNSGNDEATWAWVNDTLSVGVTRIADTANLIAGAIFVSRVYNAGTRTWQYTFSNVQPGAHNFTITVQLSTSLLDGTIINNTVTCDYAVENGFRFDRISDWSPNTTVMRPIISFTKVASAYYTTLGDYVNYTIYLNNTGTGTAANVWINDTLPSGVVWMNDSAWTVPGFAGWWSDGTTWHYNFTDVAPGYYWFNITVQVNTSITAASTLATNWAYLNYTASSGATMFPGLEANVDILIIRPIITVEKGVNLATAAFNETLIYTIWFNNTGADNAATVWINDTLPPDVTYVSDTNATEGGTWTGFWNWTFTDVAPGTHYFIIIVTVNPGAISPLVNNVNLNYTASNNFKLEESWDSVSTVVTAMAVIKVSTDYIVTVGQTYNYTIWFNNTGGTNINSVWINDTLPSGTAYLNDTAWLVTGFNGSWNNSVTWYYNFTTLPPGNYSFNITVVVNNVPPNTELENAASLIYTDISGNLQPGSIVRIISIVEGPIITVSKTVNLSVAYPGDYLNYTIYFNNTGTGNASFVWINDTLPNGVIYVHDSAWTLSTIFAGSSNDTITWYYSFFNVPPGNYWFWILVQINASDSSIYNGRLLNNTASCYYNVSIYGWRSEDYALTGVIRPVIDVDKIVNMPVATPYDTLTYIIWFNNTGSTATYVWVNDTLPFGDAGVTYISDTNSSCPGVGTSQFVDIFGNTRVWLFTNVEPGTHFFTITVIVNNTVTDGDDLQNYVKCEYQIPNGLTWNSTAFAITRIVMPYISIVKRVNREYAYPNEILTYTIWFNNTGTLTSPMVRIEDVLPAGVTFRSVSGAPPPWQSGNLLRWDFYDVAPGVHSFIIRVTINTYTPDWTPLINTAWCNFTLPNGFVLNDGTDSAFTTVIRPVIVVGKTVDKAVASPGDYLYYTIYYNNTGHGNALNVWINDTLPSQVRYAPDPIAPPYQYLIGQNIGWRFTNVPPGDHWFTFKVEILSGINGTILTNWAYCNYTCPVLNQPALRLEESWDRADTIIGLPQINIVKIANVQVVNPGDTIIYTIYYNNTGIVDAVGVTITDTLPAWVTYVGDTSGTTPAVFGTDTYTWTIGLVPALSQNSFTVTVVVSTDSALPDNEILINEVVCTYFIQNGQSWQTRDTAEVLVVKPIIELTKSVDRYYASPYDILVYYIEFNNLGSDNASFLWLNDTLPDWLTFLNHTAGNVTGATLLSSGIDGLSMWFNFTNVTPGMHSFMLTVRVNATTPDGSILTNLAICDYKAVNGLSYAPVSDYALTIVIRPVITVEKSVNQTAALPGDSLMYTIYFNNTGSGTAAYVWINDTLPTGVFYVIHTAATTGTHTLVSMGISGQSLWFNFTSVGPGTHSFTITVSIDQNLSTPLLINTVTCEYMAENGFSFEPTADNASTIVAIVVGPPIITTTPPPFVYAGLTFNLTAYVTDDSGIVQVVIYYVDIEGILWSANMSASQVDANGIGWYYFNVPAQSWKGVVSYYVWALDTSGLSNKTGWYDILVLLPPYFVWGDVIPSETQIVAGALVIVTNNQTKDSVITFASQLGRYGVDLSQLCSGYIDGQDFVVFAIDANLGWYGYSSSTIDILRYISNPQLPEDITDSHGHPYHRVDVYLNEIPEFALMIPVIFVIVITLLIMTKKKRSKGTDSNELKEEKINR